jgi:hypothetical protein
MTYTSLLLQMIQIDYYLSLRPGVEYPGLVVCFPLSKHHTRVGASVLLHQILLRRDSNRRFRS